MFKDDVIFKTVDIRLFSKDSLKVIRAQCDMPISRFFRLSSNNRKLKGPVGVVPKSWIINRFTIQNSPGKTANPRNSSARLQSLRGNRCCLLTVPV